MSVEIRVIPKDKKSLKKFVQFGTDMYKGNDCFVPPLRMDDVNTLSPDVNPAFELCDAEYFMAFRDGKPVGRIAAIIHRLSNEQRGKKEMRFGFVEFIDDEEVCDALFNAAIAWGKERGMETIIGPLGFSDMDYEGMLIEGFNELSTMATIYNYPYYPKHMERMGFEKRADWVEFQMTVPDAIPEKHQRIAEIVKQTYGLHVEKYTNRKKVVREVGRPFFDLINEAYAELFEFTKLTDRQIDYYVKIYLRLLRLDLLCRGFRGRGGCFGRNLTCSLAGRLVCCFDRLLFQCLCLAAFSLRQDQLFRHLAVLLLLCQRELRRGQSHAGHDGGRRLVDAAHVGSFSDGRVMAAQPPAGGPVPESVLTIS